MVLLLLQIVSHVLRFTLVFNSLSVVVIIYKYLMTSQSCIDSLQVKVILSDRLSSLIIFSRQETIRKPQDTMFMLPLGCQHPQHQDKQNDNHCHSDQVHEIIHLRWHWWITWKIQGQNLNNTYFVFLPVKKYVMGVKMEFP